jgi:hypothetical protein
MHLKDDVLRAFLDHELSQEEQKLTNEHLAACASCNSRLEARQKQEKLVQEKMDLLVPDMSASFSPHQALEKHLNRKKEQNKMKNWLKHPAWIAASLVVIMAVSLVFPPVRALASDLLGLFRVEQVRVISFDPALLQQMEGMQGSDDQIQEFMEQNVVAVQDGEFTQVDQLDQAIDLAGFTPRLPVQSELVSLGVMGTTQYEITIDAGLWNSILQGLGQESALIPVQNGWGSDLCARSGIDYSRSGRLQWISSAERYEPNRTGRLHYPGRNAQPRGVHARWFGRSKTR